jgi:hypothetical protein
MKKCKPNVSWFRQSNNFRLISHTGRYYPLQSNPIQRLYTAPSALRTAGRISGTPHFVILFNTSTTSACIYLHYIIEYSS